jgi:hypothetical protein
MTQLISAARVHETMATATLNFLFLCAIFSAAHKSGFCVDFGLSLASEHMWKHL